MDRKLFSVLIQQKNVENSKENVAAIKLVSN